MNFGDGQQLRKFHIVLPEDNGTAAANASTARRSTGDSLEGYVEVITHLPLKVECTVRLRGKLFTLNDHEQIKLIDSRFLADLDPN